MTWRTRERARERDVRDGDSRRVVEEDVGERARGGGAGETRGEGRRGGDGETESTRRGRGSAREGAGDRARGEIQSK